MTLTPVAPASTAITNVLEMPAQLLLAAGTFTSQDPTKENIGVVQIVLDDTGATIRSTDGHRAFRCRIPKDLLDGDFGREPGANLELQIPGAALRKAAARAQVVIIGEQMIQLLDKNRAVLELRPSTAGAWVQFPNVDQCWPAEFSYDPGRALGFSAAYMESICSIAKRLSANGNLALHFNASHTAMALTAGCAITHGGQDVQVDLEFLLMPVQIQGNYPQREVEELVSNFNATPAEQRDHITLHLKGGGGWLGGAYGLCFHSKDGKLLYSANTLAEGTAICRWIAGGTGN